MKTLARIALAFILTVAGAPAGALEPLTDLPPVLRNQVVVTGDVVHLSDIFDGIAEADDPVVAYAPAPGRRAVFDANWLARAAARNNLTWRPTSRLDRIVVERDTVTLGQLEIADILRQTPEVQALGDDVELVLSNRNARIHLAAENPGDVAVDTVTVDPDNGRLSATLLVPGGTNRTGHRLNVAGRVYPVMQVPVPAATLRPGQPIRAKDLTWARVRTAKIRGNFATGFDELVGMAPRRPLTPDVPVRLSDLRSEDTIGRGASVTIVFQTPVMLLTASGRALDAGTRGEVIRVQNLHSGKTIDAKVVAPDRVSVLAPNQLALGQPAALNGEAQ